MPTRPLELPAAPANEFLANRFQAYGVAAHLESYPFGVTWERGPILVRLLSPFPRAVQAWSWAWTEGTRGKALAGPIVRVNLATRDSLEFYKDKVRGAWLMLSDTALVWNPDGPPMTAADSAARQAELDRRSALNRSLNADTSKAAVDARQQYGIDRPYLLRKYGALGTIFDGAKEHTLATMSGSPNRVSPLPNIVVSHEDYLMFTRQVAAGPRSPPACFCRC